MSTHRFHPVQFLSGPIHRQNENAAFQK